MIPHNKFNGINVVLGTMPIGGSLNKQDTQEVLDIFKTSYNEIDTAILYQDGKTQAVLGELQAAQNFKTSIKCNPWYPSTFTYSGGLKSAVLKEQVEKSLKNLGVDKVALLYLHAPDYLTPIEESVQAVIELFQEGKFDEWGLSNYAAWQVVDIYHLCLSKGWKPPTVYQGMYNYVTRNVEPELFPALRRCNMKFYTYNPLAGGVLTGRHSFEDAPKSGRFNTKTQWGQRYLDRFWKPDVFSVLEDMKTLIKDKPEISMIDIAFRWLFFHSKLQPGDAVIIGGSTVEHIKSNLDRISKLQPLDEDILQECEKAWELSKGSCASYFRSPNDIF